MGKLCMECLDTYNNDAITTTYRISPAGLYQECPKRICDGKVYNIDDTILPSVQLLNQKGYTTVSSCGGHFESEVPELYIEFDENVKSFSHLPEGFRLKSKRINNETRLIVSYECEEDDMYEVFPSLLAAAESLYEWTEELDVVFDYSMVFFDMKSLKDYLGNGEVKKLSPEEAQKIQAEKIKEAAPEGSIKLDFSKSTEGQSVEKTPEAESEDSTEKTDIEEKPKKKRGRPRKEDK